MTRAAIGFGSNLGNRRSYLTSALKTLARRVRLVSVSSLYESAPVGPVEQGPFLNAVAVFDVRGGPEALFRELVAAEELAGRMRTERWGPRTLDLDLLLFGDQQIDTPDLHVPHPELPNRRFVIDPLVEAWPEATLPDGSPVRWLQAAVEGQAVERVGRWVSPVRLLWWRLAGSGARRNLVP